MKRVNHRELTGREKAMLAAYIPRDDLDRARVHEGRVPWYLPPRFVAITRGNRIYSRPGACAGDTADGLALLAHELVHVGQYRSGATWLTFLLSYVRHGYWNSPLEIEARETEGRIRRNPPIPGAAPPRRCLLNEKRSQ